MSEKEYVTLLKQDGISPAIEVSTQEKQYWFTLFPKDYAIQTDITRIVAQLKESSGEQGDPQNRMKSLDEEVNSVLRQVDGFWKSGTSLSEVKSLKELETELGKAREEKADLQRELDALQRQYEMTTQQKKTVQQNTAKSTNSIKQLETEVGRLKSGRDQLQHEVGVLQGKYEEATQQFERLQNKVQKLRVIYPGGQSPLEREAIIAPTSLAKVGTLELQIAPTEAALFLDEVAVGYGTAITAQLPVGWHSVTVTAEGYGPQHIMVNIQAGGTLKRTLHLSPE
ncbi:PEGA domain-containing protein [Candidatus Peregrinibacteria bacterium]|nr:PEGA domain-containing protein [Candidatus Peregrinibacteria bacterium]